MLPTELIAKHDFDTLGERNHDPDLVRWRVLKLHARLDEQLASSKPPAPSIVHVVE